MNNYIVSQLDRYLKYQEGFNKLLKSPFNDIIERQNKMQEMMKSPLDAIIERQNYMQEIMRSPLDDIIEQQNKMQEMLRSPFDDIVKQQTQIQRMLDSSFTNILKRNQIALSKNTSMVYKQLDNLKSMEYLSSIYNQLDTRKITELIEIFDEVGNKEDSYNSKQGGISEVSATLTVNSSLNLKDLTVDEFLEIIDTKLKQKDNSEPGTFKKFIKDTLNGLSTSLIYTLLGMFLIPLYITIVNLQQEQHFQIRDAIQEYVATTKEYAIDKLEIKKYIKEKGIDEYDYINHIGLIRVETFIREGKSKNAPLAYPNKLKVNSIVSVQEKKGKWLKVQLSQVNGYIEGWIEQSKVVKFKKEK